jgi:hypothetical protein
VLASDPSGYCGRPSQPATDAELELLWRVQKASRAQSRLGDRHEPYLSAHAASRISKPPARRLGSASPSPFYELFEIPPMLSVRSNVLRCTRSGACRVALGPGGPWITDHKPVRAIGVVLTEQNPVVVRSEALFHGLRCTRTNLCGVTR